jgi:hypothetical protein
VRTEIPIESSEVPSVTRKIRPVPRMIPAERMKIPTGTMERLSGRMTIPRSLARFHQPEEGPDR